MNSYSHTLTAKSKTGDCYILTGAGETLKEALKKILEGRKVKAKENDFLLKYSIFSKGREITKTKPLRRALAEIQAEKLIPEFPSLQEEEKKKVILLLLNQ